METVKAIYDFITGFGASVMMPIIVTLLGLVLGAKFGRARNLGDRGHLQRFGLRHSDGCGYALDFRPHPTGTG